MPSEVSELKETLYRVMRERDLYKNTLDHISTSIPDMMWIKDKEGKYLYANQQLINGLLFTDTLDNTLGRVDVDIAKKAKAKFGDENHTFGEVCGNSDVVVLQHQKPMHFIEHGLVNGEELVLDVYKNVIRDHNGNVIGTCGTGRDITWQNTKLKDVMASCKDKSAKEKLAWIIGKDKYE